LTFLSYQSNRRQPSARGGVVRVQVQEDRVVLSGQAATVLRGEVIV